MRNIGDECYANVTPMLRQKIQVPGGFFGFCNIVTFISYRRVKIKDLKEL